MSAIQVQPSGLSAFFKERLGASGVQLVWFGMLLLVIPFLLPFLRSFDELVQARKAGNPEYPWPAYEDLLISLYSSVILYLWKKSVLVGLKRHLLAYVHREYEGEDREERAEKMALCAYKATFFVVSSAFGYYVAKDSYFLPPSLGGHGQVELFLKDFPYQPTDSFPLIRVYIMIQLGYHLNSLMSHLSSKPRNDFMEMLLHHTLTALLIILAYYMNYVTVSLLVLLVHDVGDIFSYLIKAFADSCYKSVALGLTPGLLLSWGYFRLYVFPMDIIRVGVYENPAPEKIYGMTIFAVMLHFLLVLHIYWYCLFIRMIYRAITKNQVEDLQNRLGTKKTS